MCVCEHARACVCVTMTLNRLAGHSLHTKKRAQKFLPSHSSVTLNEGQGIHAGIRVYTLAVSIITPCLKGTSPQMSEYMPTL